MRDSDDWPRGSDMDTTRSWQQRTEQRRRRRGSPLNDRRFAPLAIGAILALLVVVGIWLWSTRQTSDEAGAPGLVVATATPVRTPTPAPTPTPTIRRATIVRLGGGPGLLHEAPGFSTPALSPILKEGDVVELLGREKQDAEGNTWQLVALGDVAGWSPENNLELLP
jgi:hypothetical protein